MSTYSSEPRPQAIAMGGTTPSPLATSSVNATAPFPAGPWTLPPRISPHLVLPDRYTDYAAMAENMPGKAVDPGRMGIWICLMDDRPHLHPTLPALHKHREKAHGIPLPGDPSKDLPTKSRSGHPRPAQPAKHGPAPTPLASGVGDGQGNDQDIAESSHGRAEEDVPMTPGTPRTAGREGEEDIAGLPEERVHESEKEETEWITWRFSDEEEARRRAYLPLA